jgi:transcriptional regulator with XRE-family HTH domain
MASKIDEVNHENLFTLGSLRKRMGLTQHQAAERMGMSLYQLQAVEKDSSKLPMTTAYKFADMYVIPVGQIFLGEEVALSDELRKIGGWE